MRGEAVDKITQNSYNTSQPFLPGEWPSRACPNEGRSKAVVIGWARLNHGAFWKEGLAGRAVEGRDGCVLRRGHQVMPGGDSQRRHCTAGGSAGARGRSSGGPRAGLGRLSAPR